MAGGGQQQSNVFDQSAASLRGATGGTAAGMGYTAQNINPAYVRPSYAGSTGYGSVSAGSQGYNAATAGSQGYTAVGPQAQGYGAAALSPDQVGNVSFSRARAGTASADWLRDTDLDPYFNPYIDNVVANTLDDVERQRQVQQTYNAARAAKAGAFGGSRQGILEAETNRGFADTAADTAAGLRDRGFMTAQQAAMGDIAQQAAISDANAMRATQASIANTNASLAASQMNATNRMGVGLANLGFENQSRQFGADAANRAASQYAAAQNTAGQFGAQAGNVASMFNAGAYNQAGQFGAQAANTAALANAGYGNQARQFGAAARNTANLANAGYGNAASLANQATNLAAQQGNQGAGLNAASLRLNAANQMGNLSNLGFNMGRTLNNDMFTQGLLQQGVNQQVIDAGRQQYAGFTGAPERALQLPIQAIGAAPVPQSQQSSYKPGLFDYLTAGVGAAGSLIPLF